MEEGNTFRLKPRFVFVKLCALFATLNVAQPADQLGPFQRTAMFLRNLAPRTIVLTQIEQNEEKSSITGKRRSLGKAKGPLLKFAGL